MSSDNPYGGPPSGPYGQGGQPPNPYGQGGQPQQPGPAVPPPYGYPPQQQPASGSGYSFGPFAGQPGESAPRPIPPYSTAPGPYGPGQPGTEPPKRRGKVLIIVGALVLALVLAGVAVALLNRNEPAVVQPQASQSPSDVGTTAPPTSAPPPAPTAKASDAVTGYLEALAAGRAGAALAYAAEPVAPGPLLTNAALARSRERAPLTGIEVPVVEDEQATTVTAAYTLGDTPVSTVFDVVKVGDAWKLKEVVKRVDFGIARSKSVPMLVNGVKVSGNTVNVLPGSYAFTTGLSTISYGSRNVVLVKGPTDYVDTYSLRVQITKSGKKAATSAVKKSYAKCLRSNDAAPKGCPNRWTNNEHRYDNNAVTWKQRGQDPFRRAVVKYLPGVAQVEVPLRVELSGACVFSEGRGTCSGRITGTAVALVTLTKKPLKARWL